MQNSNSLRVIVAAGAFALAATSLATSHGPLPAHTGGFGEPTCHRCHSDYPLNESEVVITLDSLPTAYVAGKTYPLELRVHHTELKRGGFQLTARFDDGTQAGAFTVADTAVLRVQGSGDVEYLSHNVRGTFQLRTDTAAWRFAWSAPQSGQRVVFHVAVNVANHDASEFGDRIFTARYSSGGQAIRK